MKKLFAVLLTLALVACVFAACGTTTEETTLADETTTVAEETTVEGETAE